MEMNAQGFDYIAFMERQKERPIYRAPPDNRIKNNLPREQQIVREKLRTSKVYTDDNF